MRAALPNLNPIDRKISIESNRFDKDSAWRLRNGSTIDVPKSLDKLPSLKGRHLGEVYLQVSGAIYFLMCIAKDCSFVSLHSQRELSLTESGSFPRYTTFPTSALRQKGRQENWTLVPEES